MSKRVIKYRDFEWTDLYRPSQEELESQTATDQLDLNILEDSLEYGHLPKLEKFERYTFLILRAYAGNPSGNAATVAELSNKIAFFINQEKLLTIHRAEFDFLNDRHAHYHDSEGLMLDLINQMLLTYEAPLQEQNDRMDEFEREIFLKNGHRMSVEALYYQKSRARVLRKVLQLTQNVLNQLTVKHSLNSTLQDLKDTTLSYLLQYEEVIEDANNILNTYLSLTAQRSNAVMKLLTVFSAFFLPLTFIAGIYGMNFRHMPELAWRNGYFLALVLMAAVSLIIFLWFKRKKIL